MENSKKVAEQILIQLGGRKFVAMTGAKEFLYADKDENNPNPWLRMSLRANKARVNRLVIYYNIGSDTYTMHFYKQRMDKKTFDVKITNEQKFEGVYNDSLQDVFTKVTGFLTRF